MSAVTIGIALIVTAVLLFLGIQIMQMRGEIEKITGSSIGRTLLG